jgi:hypothetical protein
VANKHRFSNQEFLAGVRDYMHLGALVREPDAEGRPSRDAMLADLRENAFYLFDGEAMRAITHAVEDLALEEANGRLMAAFQDFSQFEPHRERYGQLAATIDQVEVIAASTVPRRVRRVAFTTDRRGACRPFWFVLYEGRRAHVLLIGRQMNSAREFEEKQFLGFYTFDPRVLQRVRRDVEDLRAGRGSTMREFARQHAIDHAAKQMQTEFALQTQALHQALRRLQLDGVRYRTRNFASDLEKGLSRLSQWKARLPEILAQADAN